MVTLEGQEETRRIIIIEFPSLDDAKQFYHSEEYTSLHFLPGGEMIAQRFGFTRDFTKERNSRDC